MGLGIAGIERESDFVFGNCFLIFADLDEAESEGVVSLNKIGIDLHSFLKMLGGDTDFARLKSLSGALELFQGFGGDAKLGDGDRICRWWSGYAIRFRACVKKGERVSGVEVRGAERACARCPSRNAPEIALCGDVRSKKQDDEGTDDHAFHVATLTASHYQKLSRCRVPWKPENQARKSFASCAQFASSGKTEKVADLFGRLRVIDCKSGLQAVT